jgi:hypothetical protein
MNREDPMTRWTDALATLALAIALPAAAPSSAQAQAQADTTWICFAPTSVEENSGNATKAMDAARETFTSYLTGPSLATYPLKAKLESQVRQEAKQADCPYLLLTTLKHVQKKSGGSVFGKMAAGAAQQGHNKDEITLKYRLEKADGTVLLEKEDKRKAKSDGEDLLTPMVQQASEAIATTVSKS